MTRLVAVHFWPVEKNAALTTFSTAELKSASASTMVGFLPPISSWMRRRRLDASPCSQLPISQDPVNEMALSGLASTSASPSSPPDPATKLTTPFGSPASCSASTMRQALSGAAEAGLSTTVLPQISAGASFQAGIALGKFQGVIRPTTPIGLRMANMWTRSRSEGTSMPGMREPSPAK